VSAIIKSIRTDAFVFRWLVEEQGYEWAKGSDSEQRLVARVPESRILLYEPLRVDGMFLEFARLKDEDGILQFANKHGGLFDTYGPKDWVSRGGKVEQGSSLKKWRSEIGELHALVQIWEAITDRNVRALKSIITWNAKGVRYEIKTPKYVKRAWLAHPDLNENTLARFKPQDVLLPAQYALQAEINCRIADPEYLSADEKPAIVPRLIWSPGRMPDNEKPPRPDHHQRIIFEPTNLLAAMWLQFAQATTGQYQLKRCQGCGRYFQVGPGGRRADAKTCRDACRQRSHRRGA
jgi:hypothetical protein